jgi:hypothetical protein
MILHPTVHERLAEDQETIRTWPMAAVYVQPERTVVRIDESPQPDVHAIGHGATR